MSISASIDISLMCNNAESVEAIDIIDLMIKNDWKIQNNNKVCYLPEKDDDLFEWVEENILYEDLLKIIKNKKNLNETIGVVLYWKETDIGISLLIFTDNSISINLNINRKRLSLFNNNVDITDINWYLEKIVQCFNDKFNIVEINFNQSF